MKIAGIICEYNPFHKGHEYQIAEIKRRLGSDLAIVCLMSGGYVQRADCGVFDKYSRAEAGIRGGADLVLELPITAAIASAQGFASGGVSYLNRLGCVNYLGFGSECGELTTLQSAASALLSSEYPEKLKEYLSGGLSFAAARHKAAASIDEAAAEVLENPNDILAVEYLLALSRENSAMSPVVIPRIGASHDGEAAFGYASASEIRKALGESNDTWRDYVPKYAAQLYEKELFGNRIYSLKNAEKAILYRLRTMTNADFDALPFGGEGLNIRFMRNARKYSTIDEIVDKTKTKRYAHSRIRRMLLCAYLGVTEEEIKMTSPYLRVLAFNDKGREVIKSCDYPILQLGKQAKKLGGEAKRYFELECRAADLLSLCLPDGVAPIAGEEWVKRSKYLEKQNI